MSATRRGSNLLSKKVIIVFAVLAVGAASAILVASSIAQTTIAQQEQQEQQQRMMMMWSGQQIPQINGSVNVANETINFVNENVNVSFVEAAQAAQEQITNGTVLGGHLGVVQGYLVYKFFVANTANQTGHMTIVDPGNGNVLYSMSEGQPLGFFGHPSIFGPWSGSGHGYGGSDRPWKGQWSGLWG